MSFHFSGVVLSNTTQVSNASLISELLNRPCVLTDQKADDRVITGLAADDIVLAYTGNGCSVLLMDIEYAIDGFCPAQYPAFSFSVCEVSGAYQWLLWDGESITSEYRAVDGHVLDSHGLSLDTYGADAADIIAQYISHLLGQPWPELTQSIFEHYQLNAT